MNTLILTLIVAIVALILFVMLPASLIAQIIKRAIPFSLIAIGGFLSLLGKIAIGGPLVMFGLILWQRSRPVGRFGGPSSTGTAKSSGVSTVRSAALEMELNHATGAMNGLVLAGQFSGAELDALSEEQVLELRIEISSDADSVALLDAYLDRRIPGWGEHADFEPGAGQGSPSRAGAMSEQEAYEILGLAEGASLEEIRAAHRRLLKGMHPDRGGSTFLAAKINEAKDVLFNSHS